MNVHGMATFEFAAMQNQLESADAWHGTPGIGTAPSRQVTGGGPARRRPISDAHFSGRRPDRV